MRKIEVSMCSAVREHRDWSCDNTMVKNVAGVSHVYLHGNLIAIVAGIGCDKFTLAGWNTKTTRSRLNALGACVRCKQFKPTHKGTEIDENEWYNF